MTTYYVSTSGNDNNPGTISSPWRTIQHSANSMSAGDNVYVRGGTYNEKITISNSGNSTNYITFLSYPGEISTIDAKGAAGVGVWDALVKITGSYITFQNFNVINSGWAGIYVQSTNSVTVQGNYIAETYSSGIIVGGAGPGNRESSNIKILNNELYHTSGYASDTQESISIQYGVNGFEVAGNYLHDVGPGGVNGMEGIDAKNGAQNGIIHHNHLIRIPSVAIYVDAFGFYANNIDVYDNLVEGGSSGISVSAEGGGTSDTVRIYNNIIKNTGIAGTLLPAYDGSSGGTIKNITIINNTYYGNTGSDGGIWIGAWSPTYIQNLIIRNNIFSQNNPTQIKETNTGRHSGITIDYNLFNGSGGALGSNIVTGDPLFINASNGDFHLQSSSPAIGKGTSTNSPPLDYDRKARPSPPSIGAFEYISGTAACATNLAAILKIA